MYARRPSLGPHGRSNPNGLLKQRLLSRKLYENVQTLDCCAENMSIIAAYNDAWDNADVDALAEILHDEFVFNPHVGGITMGKSDALGFASAAATTSEGNRILFENDEVGVSHSVVHFANGSTSEAVLFFMRFKDGKIVLIETGATPLSDDYRLVGSD